MYAPPRVRGEDSIWLSRAQLTALGIMSISTAILAFFIGLELGQRKVPEPVVITQDIGLIPAEVESDALVELLAKVEQAAAKTAPTTEAAVLSFPTALTETEVSVLLPAPPAPGEGEELLVAPGEAASAPPSAEIGSAPSSGYALQIATVESAEEAKAKVEAATAAGLKAFSVAALDAGVTRWHVRVGPYADEKEANKAKAGVLITLGLAEATLTRVR
jgi:cell division septation protein DedD